MVFTRPIRSLVIPKMIPPVAQPMIIKVVAQLTHSCTRALNFSSLSDSVTLGSGWESPALAASARKRSSARAGWRARMKNRWSMQSNNQPPEAISTTTQW